MAHQRKVAPDFDQKGFYDLMGRAAAGLLRSSRPIITTGPTRFVAGDNPGGIEAVSVMPLSGRGVSSKQGGEYRFAGGTGSITYYPEGRQNPGQEFIGGSNNPQTVPAPGGEGGFSVSDFGPPIVKKPSKEAFETKPKPPGSEDNTFLPVKPQQKAPGLANYTPPQTVYPDVFRKSTTTPGGFASYGQDLGLPAFQTFSRSGRYLSAPGAGRGQTLDRMLAVKDAYAAAQAAGASLGIGSQNILSPTSGSAAGSTSASASITSAGFDYTGEREAIERQITSEKQDVKDRIIRAGGDLGSGDARADLRRVGDKRSQLLADLGRQQGLAQQQANKELISKYYGSSSGGGSTPGRGGSGTSGLLGQSTGGMSYRNQGSRFGPVTGAGLDSAQLKIIEGMQDWDEEKLKSYNRQVESEQDFRLGEKTADAAAKRQLDTEEKRRKAELDFQKTNKSDLDTVAASEAARALAAKKAEIQGMLDFNNDPANVAKMDAEAVAGVKRTLNAQMASIETQIGIQKQIDTQKAKAAAELADVMASRPQQIAKDAREAEMWKLDFEKKVWDAYLSGENYTKSLEAHAETKRQNDINNEQEDKRIDLSIKNATNEKDRYNAEQDKKKHEERTEMENRAADVVANNFDGAVAFWRTKNAKGGDKAAPFVFNSDYEKRDFLDYMYSRCRVGDLNVEENRIKKAMIDNMVRAATQRSTGPSI